MNHSPLRLTGLLLIGLFLAPPLLAQNADQGLSEHGVPDLQGIYTYRTLTPLNRPVELADKEVLTPQEAQEWEAYENQRQIGISSSIRTITIFRSSRPKTML